MEYSLLLVDCNNFFVSCERVKNRELDKKPVVVISHTGGIVVARSNEAKAVGIPMGAPLFQYEKEVKKYGVISCLPQFHLYRSLSNQVMEILKTFASEVEVYSVDEAFLGLPNVTLEEAKEIRREVWKQARIPVSIGVANTKTLCKAAVYFAKKEKEHRGIYFLKEEDFQRLPVGEVWGVGKGLAGRLFKKSIYTAADLIRKEDYFLQKELSVVGLRIAMELRGTPCYLYQEDGSPHKSVQIARSFSSLQTSYEPIEEALVSYVKKAADTVFKEHQLAEGLTVWVETSFFGPHEKYANSQSTHLVEPTNFAPKLIVEAKKILKEIFKSGYRYKKVGVMLGPLSSDRAVQGDLFELKADTTKLNHTVAALRQRYGKDIVFFGQKENG